MTKAIYTSQFCSISLRLQKALLVVLLGLMIVEESICTLCSVPEIRDRQNNKEYLYADVGSDIKLPCSVQKKGLEWQWQKDNQTLRVDHSPRMSLKAFRWLKIKQVRKDDEGLYSCIVQNECGRRAAVHMRLILRELAPRFTMRATRKFRLRQIALPVGNSVKLDCSAEGHPSPTVRWYKNGKPFKERRGSSLHLDRAFVLALKAVVPSDTGKYTCNISNDFGWINHSYYVDVHERVRAKPVVLPITNASVSLGGNATLLCRAFSDSMPHFQWLRWFPLRYNSSSTSSEMDKLHFRYEVIKKNKQDSATDFSSSIFHEETLSLINVTKKVEGKYTCIAGNAVGYAVQNAYILVHEKSEEIHDADGNISTTSATIQSLSDSPKTNGQEGNKPEEKKSWTDEIRHPWLLLGFAIAVLIALITAPALFFWKLRKLRASSITAPPVIASLQPKYDAKNEYVVVPDFI